MPDSYSPSDGVLGGDRPLADLAQVLAHRMRGPLTSIQCYTELLADSVGAYEERDMVLRIFESVSLLEKTLADLHRYSFTVEPMPRVLDACQLMEDVLTGLGDTKAEVEVEVQPGTMIQGDPLLIQQALLILLENALDAEVATATPQAVSRVRCSVKQEPSSTSPAMTRFEVWNAGPLDVSEAQVFSPFFTTKSSNLGIGLPIARRIADAHGGSLHLTTRGIAIGETGVTFTLLLPSAANYINLASFGTGIQAYKT
ncbi:MAG: HAMP domain-containing histidine kinase [Rhodothermaceae bacterium]|nr:HAMP domain-containing histidine kinase [Rhodothermaceae bacterium]